MSVESVRNFFSSNNLPNPIITLEESGATVDLAAKTLGISPELVAKTLAFRLKDKDILIVTKGNARIDNKKYKSFFKVKAKMLSHDEVADITGHPIGGVCPFGLKNSLEVYIDESIKCFDLVYPAAGSIFTALKISPSQMLELTGGKWVDVCL